jgi:hypothetical protein
LIRLALPAASASVEDLKLTFQLHGAISSGRFPLPLNKQQQIATARQAWLRLQLLQAIPHGLLMRRIRRLFALITVNGVAGRAKHLQKTALGGKNLFCCSGYG